MTDTEAQSLRGEYAGFVTRLVAFIIDIVLVATAILVVSGIGTLILHFFNLDTVLEEPLATDSSFLRLFRIIYNAILLLIYLILIVGYHPFFWMLVDGRTPGKYLLGIQVISQTDQKLHLGQCFKRFIGYWFSALVLFLGYLSVLIDDERRSWHDKFAKTSVTYVWEARYNRSLVRRVKERQALHTQNRDSQHE